MWRETRQRTANASYALTLVAVLLLTGSATTALDTGPALPADSPTVKLPGATVPAAGEPLAGQTLWEAGYDGPVSGSDWGQAVATHPSGLLVYVTGNSQQSETGGAEIATLAYEATTGLPVWEARWDGSGGASDFPNAIGVDLEGASVYVAGYSGTFGDLEYAVLAYDALSGGLIWEARYAPLTGQNVAYDLAVDPSGQRVFVTGGAEGPGSGRDIATVAFDANTGEELWDARYSGPGDALDIGWAVATAGERVFVAGNVRADSPDMATIAYDAESGATLWAALHDGPGGSFDNAFDLAVHPDGDLVFTGGYTNHPDSSNDLSVVAYDATTGAEAWVSRFDGPASGADYAKAITVDPSGQRVYATGYSWGGSATRADWATVAFGAEDGAVDWVTRYDGPASGLDAGEALAVSDDGGRLFVTGYSADTQAGRDYATAAYDAGTGEEIWSAQYDGGAGGTDHPRAIAVDPMGLRVYVTGNSWEGSHSDFATLSYLDLR